MMNIIMHTVSTATRIGLSSSRSGKTRTRENFPMMKKVESMVNRQMTVVNRLDMLIPLREMRKRLTDDHSSYLGARKKG